MPVSERINMTFFSHSSIETENFAFDLAKNISAPRVICLIGDLGAGKTAFVRGFARFFGVEKGVCSPTFTIMHQYSGTVLINHYDLYRINDFEELLDIGFEDQIEHGISLIEWPDNFLDFIPSDSLMIKISHGEEENTRIIEVEE